MVRGSTTLPVAGRGGQVCPELWQGIRRNDVLAVNLPRCLGPPLGYASSKEHGRQAIAALRAIEERETRMFASNADGTGPSSQTAHATTADVAGPVPTQGLVNFTGDKVSMAFGEPLEGGAGRTPPGSAFTVLADGFEVDAEEVEIRGSRG